jgi:hypothetical protein
LGHYGVKMGTYASASSKYASTATQGVTASIRSGNNGNIGNNTTPVQTTAPTNQVYGNSGQPYQSATTTNPYRGPSIPATSINPSGNVTSAQIHQNIQQGLSLAAMDQQERQTYISGLSPQQATELRANPLVMQYGQTTIYQTPLERRAGSLDTALQRQSLANYPTGPATVVPLLSPEARDAAIARGEATQVLTKNEYPQAQWFEYGGERYSGQAAAEKIRELKEQGIDYTKQTPTDIGTHIPTTAASTNPTEQTYTFDVNPNDVRLAPLNLLGYKTESKTFDVNNVPTAPLVALGVLPKEYANVSTVTQTNTPLPGGGSLSGISASTNQVTPTTSKGLGLGGQLLAAVGLGGFMAAPIESYGEYISSVAKSEVAANYAPLTVQEGLIGVGKQVGLREIGLLGAAGAVVTVGAVLAGMAAQTAYTEVVYPKWQKAVTGVTEALPAATSQGAFGPGAGKALQEPVAASLLEFGSAPAHYLKKDVWELAYVAKGLSPEEAQQAANEKFGYNSLLPGGGSAEASKAVGGAAVNLIVTAEAMGAGMGAVNAAQARLFRTPVSTPSGVSETPSPIEPKSQPDIKGFLALEQPSGEVKLQYQPEYNVKTGGQTVISGGSDFTMMGSRTGTIAETTKPLSYTSFQEGIVEKVNTQLNTAFDYKGKILNTETVAGKTTSAVDISGEARTTFKEANADILSGYKGNYFIETQQAPGLRPPTELVRPPAPPLEANVNTEPPGKLRTFGAENQLSKVYHIGLESPLDYNTGEKLGVRIARSEVRETLNTQHLPEVDYITRLGESKFALYGEGTKEVGSVTYVETQKATQGNIAEPYRFIKSQGEKGMKPLTYGGSEGEAELKTKTLNVNKLLGGDLATETAKGYVRTQGRAKAEAYAQGQEEAAYMTSSPQVEQALRAQTGLVIPAMISSRSQTNQLSQMSLSSSILGEQGYSKTTFSQQGVNVEPSQVSERVSSQLGFGGQQLNRVNQISQQQQTQINKVTGSSTGLVGKNNFLGGPITVTKPNWNTGGGVIQRPPTNVLTGLGPGGGAGGGGGSGRLRGIGRSQRKIKLGINAARISAAVLGLKSRRR